MVPVPVAQATVPAADASALDEAHRALEQAKELGQRVEVQGERSERTSVFANPDGFTFTLEQHSVPIRVAKPGGGWQIPDATLEHRADGTVGPRAASAEMIFSGGADDEPLVKIAARGNSLELDWKADLPAPELDGANAVYRNVLPDVDLKLTATVESFQQVLVVKTPQAAANPALKELTFDLKTEGLAVRKGAAGNLAAVDGNGNTVFRSPPAQMWDSAGRAATTDTTSDTGTGPQLMKQTASDAQPTPSDPSEQAASGTGLEPGQGDNVSRMDVRVTQDSLSVVPDADMLTGTAADAYPIFIDPTVTWGESERTLLRSDGYESYGWGNGTDNVGQGAGKCGSWNGYYCGPGYVQRLYFEFAPDSLKGKRVLDATFAVTEPWAFQCDPRWVDLVRTDNISSTTTWTTRPKELDWLVDRYVSAGRGSLCDPDSPDAPIEFNDAADEPNENLTPTVQDFAAGRFSRLTLEIRAHDESDAAAWKRFRNDAVLRVSYVAYPAKPTGVGIVGGSGTALCSTNAADPAIVSDPTPTLNSTPQTAAGGESGARLKAWLRIESQAADGTWSGSGIAAPSGTGFVGDNVKVTTSWPSTSALKEGPLHRYSSLTQAFYDNGAYSQSSGYVTWCYFKVDPTAPKQPTVTFNGPYIECLPDNCPAAGAPGVVGSFTFGPAAGDTNIKQYEYRLGEASDTGTPATTWTTLAPGVLTASIKPPAEGTYVLEVRAKDVLGRPGAPRGAQLKVAKGDAPVGRWHFDEADGTALDSAPTGGASDAVLTGPAARDDSGRRGKITHDAQGLPLEENVIDKGLALDGATGYAATNGAVLGTGSSYTVSAWVRLTDGSRNATTLGQDPALSGGWYSAFYLGYRADSKKWELRTSPKDATDGDISNQIVQSKQPAVVDVWTHLAAVYDNDTKLIKLYVNGELQGTDTVVPSWTSTGRLQFGRAWWRGAYYDYWKGSIDEVAAWQRALIDSEVADEARLLLPGGMTGVELVADWSAGGVEDGVTTVADTSGYGRSLTLQGEAAVSAGKIVLNGGQDAAAAAGPIIDNKGSFTVSTQVSLDRAEINNKPDGYIGQVVGERTADGSSWGLWFKRTSSRSVFDDVEMVEVTVPVGYWFFGRLNADGSTFTGVQSEKEAVLDTGVRLTGIFDAQSGKIALRVVNKQDAEWQQYSAQSGTGEIAVGKGMSGAAYKHYLPAKVTGVRVWAGAMNNENQIQAQVGS
ncbi:LamG domain-containing protein [Streptomyces sp. ID05-39B]|uniref:LamG domain-containing protein n=1 Tax=Streptomyces sp. ID05-39B TaxID=3028664 RepID=UPI0029AF0F23|nr:LamG domain-containing protein [Streptomyces sp. ID05-39B]MDX3530060.1 LamG domain-containing protein [Streptomyces sp. ID05-39B]